MCIALTILFHVLEYVSDTPLDLAEEDGQMDYTMNVSRGKKTTSTPKETVTDVDLTGSPEHRPAPGGPGGSSPAPSLPEGLPTPTKLKDKEQGRNLGKTSVPVASDKSTNSKKGKDGSASGDQEGLQVAFMHSELTCIREHVEKIAVVPQEIALLRNSIESTQGDLGVVGTQSLAIQSNVTSIAADITTTGTEVSSFKTHLIGLRSDTMALKSDIHGLAKNVVESKLLTRSTKDEVASARVDIVRVGDDINIAKSDVLGVDRKVSLMGSDLATLKHEVNVMKSDVVCIKKELAGFKSEIATIAAGVQSIQWSLSTNSASQYRDIGMCTDVEQIEVKSETGSPQPTAAEGDVHAPVEGVEGVQNPEEAVPPALDTSEVSFRPQPDAATYENVERITKESRVELDSEIDVVEGTQCGPTRPGDIVYSVPPQPTQQVPLNIIANTGFPETQKESQSQSILQFSTDSHTEVVVGPVVSTEVEINTGDPVEAGPAMEEPPLKVISEAQVDKNGKTFFVLETQVAQPDNQTGG